MNARVTRAARGAASNRVEWESQSGCNIYITIRILNNPKYLASEISKHRIPRLGFWMWSIFPSREMWTPKNTSSGIEPTTTRPPALWLTPLMSLLGDREPTFPALATAHDRHCEDRRGATCNM